MRTEPILDLSDLPSYAYGQRSILWWGTLGFCLIEGTAFALALVGYFYLRGRAGAWPPDGIRPPDLSWGTLNTAILLASCIPNQWVKQAAEREEIGPVRLWLIVCLGFGLAFNAVRGFEFGVLNVRWDDNAYGSIAWTLLGLHTTHLVTDVADTIVLAVLMMTGPLHRKRLSDVTDNAFYWDFVVLAWIPIYAVLYLAPRLSG